MSGGWQVPELARERLRGGHLAEALEIANHILADDPGSADALLTRAAARIASGQLKDALADLRVASDLRSAAWVFERLHAEFQFRATVNLGGDDALKLGGFIRQRLSALPPPLPPQRRRAKHSYVNVVGASLVRGFGGNTCFLPVFAGMGPGTLLLTDETARVTTHKLVENLKRVDVTRPTIIALSSDGYYHLENMLALRASREAPLDDHDFKVMEAVAERHRAMLLALSKVVTGKLMLLAVTPSTIDRLNILSHHLNACLAKVCREIGVGFLDWWDDLADPATDRLRDDYGAHAYPGDSHFSLEVTGLFIDRLKEIGVLEAAVPSARTYEWSHVFEYDVGVGEKTRIWCEPSISPNNAIKSHKIAASHVAGKVADLMATTCLAGGPASALYVNVRDGYLPVIMPPSLVPRSVALTASPRDVETAQAVLDLYGRTDVIVREQSDAVLGELAGFQPRMLIATTFPDTEAADLSAINAALGAMTPPSVAAFMLIDPAKISQLHLGGYQVCTQIALGNRFLPEAWQAATLFIVKRRPRA